MPSKNSKKVKKLNFPKPTSLRLLNFILLFALIGTLFLHFTLAATAGYLYSGGETTHVSRINQHRASTGRVALSWSGCLTNAAREHAKTMSAAGYLYHSSLANLITRHCGNYGYGAAENVGGFHSNSTLAMDQYIASTLHRANIEGNYSHVGTGVWKRADGTESSVHLFAQQGDGAYGNFSQAVNANPVPSYNAGSPAPPVTSTIGTKHYLRNTNSSGNHDVYFNYGSPNDIPFYCDWNGDGKDTIGVFRKGVFYLSDTNGVANYSFGFGNPDDIPVCGDWNGDGKDTIGLYRSSNATFYLRNANSNGGSDLTFSYGSPGDKPVAGDWNGDSIDTIGIVRGTTYYLRNANTSGIADVTVTYGDPGDARLVGDWDGNGTDTPGLWRKGAFYLRNSNTSGAADITLSYGSPTDYPVVGDFDANRTTTIGIVRP